MADAANQLDLVFRELTSPGDYRACVELQLQTWGKDYADVVPASMLQITRKMGGVAGGAFDRSGALVGFVYGVTGLRGGRVAHWSHMLAVVPRLRNRGIGRRLKEYQRAEVRKLGVDVMYWTFDPLVARNGHLNLNRLGARVTEYVPDLYAETGSPLHSFGTDRFIVAWDLKRGSEGATRDDPFVEAESTSGSIPEDGERGSDAPVVNTTPRRSEPETLVSSALRVRIEVPEDVETLVTVDIDSARRWRAATRAAFLTYLERRYSVRGFYRDGTGCFYVLEAGER